MNCGSCDYWVPMETDGGPVVESTVGGCHRHAPVVVVQEPYGRWPITIALQSCGDWQRHPTRRLTTYE